MTRLQDCQRCPRLVATRQQTALDYPDYHAAPVPAWGSRRARLLIVGLAPGMHGANRTGRPFCGDASGDFLFAGLHRVGLTSTDRADTARLLNARITNAVKCLPPGNRPSSSEVGNCQDHLAREVGELLGDRPRRHRVVLALGGVAHGAVCRVLGLRGIPFKHGHRVPIADGVGTLIDSFHPSRLNTQTGRLTEAMFDALLGRVVDLLDR